MIAQLLVTSANSHTLSRHLIRRAHTRRAAKEVNDPCIYLSSAEIIQLYHAERALRDLHSHFSTKGDTPRNWYVGLDYSPGHESVRICRHGQGGDKGCGLTDSLGSLSLSILLHSLLQLTSMRLQTHYGDINLLYRS